MKKTDLTTEECIQNHEAFLKNILEDKEDLLPFTFSKSFSMADKISVIQRMLFKLKYPQQEPPMLYWQRKELGVYNNSSISFGQIDYDYYFYYQNKAYFASAKKELVTLKRAINIIKKDDKGKKR